MKKHPAIQATLVSLVVTGIITGSIWYRAFQWHQCRENNTFWFCVDKI